MITKKRDFAWAVAQMKEGKKVYRKSWAKEEKIFIENKSIKSNLRLRAEHDIMLLETFEATDWEIYEEEDNWNLAKAFSSSRTGTMTDNVKTFIQKLKDKVKIAKGCPDCNQSYQERDCVYYSEFDEIIDKLTGDLE